MSAGLYAYLGIVFFALYRARTMARTIGRVALFVAVDLALSFFVSGVLFIIVYRSVLLI